MRCVEGLLVLLPAAAAVWRQIKMYLCEYCEEGQLEMCQYFKEHFLETECPAVTACPKFKERKQEDDHT